MLSLASDDSLEFVFCSNWPFYTKLRAIQSAVVIIGEDFFHFYRIPNSINFTDFRNGQDYTPTYFFGNVPVAFNGNVVLQNFIYFVDETVAYVASIAQIRS